MSLLQEIDLGKDFEPFQFFTNNFGFVPNLFRAQSLLPRVLTAETDLTRLLLVEAGELPPIQKQSILLLVAGARQNTYSFTLYWNTLQALGVAAEQLRAMVIDHHNAGLAAQDVKLLDFALKLTHHPLWIGQSDFDSLRDRGLRDEQILEAELMAAYEIFSSTLCVGLQPEADFERQDIPLRHRNNSFSPSLGLKATAPYLRTVLLAEDFGPYGFFKEKMGFVPSFFRAQTMRPDLIESQARALDAVLLPDDILSRVQKEYIFLVISAANLNTYCVANHCGLLRGLGIPDDRSDQIAFNHHDAGLSDRDVVLLDFALNLTQRPAEFSVRNIETLRLQEFSEEQILEAVVLSGFANFINTMNVALGVQPDFEPKHVFEAEHLAVREDLQALGEISLRKVNLSDAAASLSDEDASVVARVCAGDVQAFEDLVRRHGGRVYRTLISITGRPDDAEDYCQNVFLKAFRSLGSFEGTAKFSTWLTRIAINEGIERSRKLKQFESLDESAAGADEDFRPRQVQAWADDPERLYSKKETREIVEREIMKLPAKYRLAVMLRDIEDLSNDEAAAALELGHGAFKSRLLRGRLMLREALAAQFRKSGEGTAHV